MTGSRLRPAFLVGLFLGLLVVALQGVQSEELDGVPPEDLCRPYIEKALKDLGTGSLEQISAEIGAEDGESQQEGALPGSEEQADEPGGESTEEGSQEVTEADVSAEREGEGSREETAEEQAITSDEQADEQADKVSGEDEQADASAGESAEVTQADEVTEEKSTEIEEEKQSSAEAATDSEEAIGDEEGAEQKSAEETEAGSEETAGTEEIGAETSDEQKDEESPSDEVKSEEKDETTEDGGVSEGDVEGAETDEGNESKGDETEADDVGSEPQAEDEAESAAASDEETVIEEDDSKAHEEASKEEAEVSKEGGDTFKEEEASQVEADEGEASTEASVEDAGTEQEDQAEEDTSKEAVDVSAEGEEGDDQEKTDGTSQEEAEHVPEEGESEDSSKEKEAAEEATDDKAESAEEATDDKAESVEEASDQKAESAEEATDEKAESTEEVTDAKAESGEEADEDVAKSRARREVGDGPSEETTESTEAEVESGGETGAIEEQEPTPEEDLIEEIVVPEHLRPRDHIDQLLKLDVENEEKERAIQNMADIILRDLKRLYDNAIQPLETLYKYRDLSNRHFGDPEIFSKPLVLFMGPWSGGKSSIINYLLDIEYKQTSLRTGAEPSPAYFNILMHGEEEEILDGTQLAADWTFSGLQKFGQGLLDRLRGLKLNNKLLDKVNIVEIPGILEVRKQVQRVFPFNDACQWFIDRADIIFLVYDPSKLDVGPETEAILDQLKGREYQTRIILNKADQVKPEELMRVQGALIWNISPLMSSAEPPIMYSTSLWSLPYEAGAPTRLLYAQERAFLRDLRSAIDKRVEHKIASARRFAVRVRNHAKMVDCYLTTYYNHKTFFGNKKEISDKIIENPQDYHIYEGLSTLTNISRYDLPDPDVYRDFFRLNALYDFQQLSATCTYFRGCPINRLDVAIAYDLPELVGKYKKSVEAVIHESEANSPLS